ncbi:MAG: hypothetical protein PHC88_06105 [Terrimicrobiaceae bacterium]|nr:hypothetical protein [Terrimicrobiaceae bacterium]
MPKKTTLATTPPDNDPLSKLYNAIESFISAVPSTDEHKSKDPVARARHISNSAAAKAALVSGGLALPPGPLGLATILPDLIAIYKIQAQMVADIAGVFGKTASLTPEQMLYCLFKHAAAQLVRDLVTRVGERVLVRRVSLRVMQRIIQKIAGRVTQRVIGKAISRWLPIIGPLAVGGYAYYDTAQVGKTATELFQQEIKVEARQARKKRKA